MPNFNAPSCRGRGKERIVWASSCDAAPRSTESRGRTENSYAWHPRTRHRKRGEGKLHTSRDVPGKEETKGVPSYAPASNAPPRKNRVAARLSRKTKEGKTLFLGSSIPHGDWSVFSAGTNWDEPSYMWWQHVIPLTGERRDPRVDKSAISNPDCPGRTLHYPPEWPVTRSRPARGRSTVPTSQWVHPKHIA